MGDQEIQEVPPQNQGAGVEPQPVSLLDKITKVIKTAVITMVVGAGLLLVVGWGGSLAWSYITSDHSVGAEVSYQYLEDGQGYFLVVQNQDSKTWQSPTITVNGTYKFRSQDLAGKTIYNFDLTKFLGDGGERFLPDRMLPVKVKIETGWDSSEWSFQQ